MGDLDDLSDWHPVASIDVPREINASEQIRFLRWNWLVVYVLNLPVCILLGLSLLKDSAPAVFGMLTGTSILFALGLFVCRTVQRLGLALVLGGTIVAIMQCFPLAQYGAGAIGVILADKITRAGWVATILGGDPLEFACGLIATMATGGSLMVLALVLSRLIRLLTPKRWWDEIPQLHPGWDNATAGRLP